jgi:beta-N-acetylhexosaminidase
LGPSLDVLETPRPLTPGGLGTRVFGGDPYWVGSLGRSYIRGVHAGGAGRVAVAAKFFPGYGASDRDPVEEVPTVRKSLEELTHIDLLPFFMVTGAAADEAATADALMSAHIRFQGFQGNIRETTSPVSFDPRAFAQLMALPELSTWREAGGLTVSDALGTRAVKRFYDPAEREFNPRRIASEAFIAGNDVLFLADFGLNPRQDQTRNIADVIAYFTQRYTEDRTFASRVDGAVARILQLKLRLYGGRFELQSALRPDERLAELGQGRPRVLDLARHAATLISPSLEELAARAPEPPGPAERLVFITDSQVGRQCTECALTPLLDRKALENAVLQFYGPSGSGQVNNPRNLQSFTFDDLATYLNARANPPPTAAPETPAPEALPVETALNQADWIVLAMLNVTSASPDGNLVSTFLSQRPDILRSKKIVVFAFGAPYYLDTTDLSKVTAFYALYSRAPAFVEVAARLLFRELVPGGSPPVSVEGVDYALIRVTAPDPAQTIQLFSDTPLSEAGTPAPSETVTPTLGLKVGDMLDLRTSVILDLNGHPVPDGTPARFMLVYTAGDGSRDFAFIDTETREGVARASLTLNRIGFLEISISEPAVERSTKLQIPVQQGTTFFITPIAPPTDTPTVTPSPTVTPTPSATATISPTPEASGDLQPRGTRVGGGDFIVMLLGLVAVLVAGYRLGGADAQPRRAVRLALLGAIGVLAGYNFFALSLPGATVLWRWFGMLAPVVCVALGAGAGLGVGWYWALRSSANR